MATYVRLPVEVEAVQWFKMGDHPRVTGHSPSDGYIRGDSYPAIWNPSGVVIVRPGDWIITEPDGSVYTCKPAEFAAKYAAVADVNPEVVSSDVTRVKRGE